jgi:hypothetical protein
MGLGGSKGHFSDQNRLSRAISLEDPAERDRYSAEATVDEAAAE